MISLAKCAPKAARRPDPKTATTLIRPVAAARQHGGESSGTKNRTSKVAIVNNALAPPGSKLQLPLHWSAG